MTLRVSDHAVLRFMERSLGLDVEAVRARILVICQPAAAVGAKAVKHDGVKFVISDMTVTTVLPKLDRRAR